MPASWCRASPAAASRPTRNGSGSRSARPEPAVGHRSRPIRPATYPETSWKTSRDPCDSGKTSPIGGSRTRETDGLSAPPAARSSRIPAAMPMSACIRAEHVRVVRDQTVAERAAIVRVARAEDDGVRTVRRPGELRLDQEIPVPRLALGEGGEGLAPARHLFEAAAVELAHDRGLPGAGARVVLDRGLVVRGPQVEFDLRGDRSVAALPQHSAQAAARLPSGSRRRSTAALS